MEHPIIDTTATSTVQYGMWCEFDDVDFHTHRSGFLEDVNGSFALDDRSIIYIDGTLACYVKNLRVYEHKPKPEYPTESGLYRFGDIIYRMYSNGERQWQAIQNADLNEFLDTSFCLLNDDAMQARHPGVTPIRYVFAEA